MNKTSKNNNYIYGAIGRTILVKNKTNFDKSLSKESLSKESVSNKNSHNILIMADMHDHLQKCKSSINVSDWLKSKFETSTILLEEVDRNNVYLKELWKTSEHTQGLKNLYLNNQKNINPIDIRPQLIEYSWELFDSLDNEDKNSTLKQYLSIIDSFFNYKFTVLLSKNYYKELHKQNNNNLIKKHFNLIKKTYNEFLTKYDYLLNYKMKIIIKKFYEINKYINKTLDQIMEWYTCAEIYINVFNKNVILHAGLAHTDKIIKWLIILYNYKRVSEQGINSMMDTNIYTDKPNGCIELNEYNSLFGGGIFK